MRGGIQSHTVLTQRSKLTRVNMFFLDAGGDSEKTEGPTEVRPRREIKLENKLPVGTERHSEPEMIHRKLRLPQRASETGCA